ncbi:amino acid adenylation domain-containing protein [Aquimarina sp. MMG015]|uniref:non-ribosomal peptide synthetase n=1 Tax=Aquimarina sp. MMG015 TaxID=2822689 RepID=UPI001B3A76ED|nr:non-ribosomal peptide synthetase [Aquimarina sp. MMG015]MBQ4803340.1 amino acid adenylation domain-containing protein [Aquimarina sp. MMG015]
MRNLLKELRERNIYVSLQGEELKLKFNGEKLPDDLISRIKEYKQEIIKHLKQGSQQNNSKEKIPNIPLSEEGYMLSNSQNRLWILDQAEGGLPAYNISNQTILDGNYNIDLFKEAIFLLLDRHEILRTVFRKNNGGEPRQFVLSSEEINFKIDYVDLRGEEEQNEAIINFIKKDTYRVFSIEKGPLLSAALIHLENEKYIFHYNMHHIISDGWSLKILANEVIKIYNNLCSDEIGTLRPLRIQYKDFAAWQSAKIKNGNYSAHQNFWNKHLSGKLPRLNLPSNKQRPSIKTNKGELLEMYLPSKVVSGLHSFAKQNNGSLFISILSIWNILMHKYSGEKDIIIGTPVAGREHIDLENQIGFYVNTLALRNNVDPDNTFIEHYNYTKERVLSALSYQTYPFDLLVNELNIQRDSSRNVVFDIMLALQNTEKISKSNNHEITPGEVYSKGESRTKFDIGITFFEVESLLKFQINFNTAIYDKEMITQMMHHFKLLSEACITSYKLKICDIDFLSEKEKQKQLFDFNSFNLGDNEGKTFLEYFNEQVKQFPQYVAIQTENRKINYIQLDNDSNQIAKFLIKSGIRKGDFVPFSLADKADAITMMLGIMKVGAAYVPIYDRFIKGEVNNILNDIEAKLFITDLSIKQERGNIDDVSLVSYEDMLSGSFESEIIEPVKIDKDDIVYVIYTSGTTGKPKGVLVTHGNLGDYLLGLIQKLNIEKKSHYGLMSTLGADLGYTFLYGALATAGTLHVFSDEMLKDSPKLISYFKNNIIDYIKIVPEHWNSIYYDGTYLIPQKAIVFGGSVLNMSVIENLNRSRAKIDIYNHYGPTETTIGKLMHKVDLSYRYNSVYIGKPFSNTKIYVLGPNLELLPIGCEGELCIGGDGVSKGYLKRNNLTDEKYISNPYCKSEKLYRTGDIVKWTSDGKIVFLGRKDDQLKIRGYRVEPNEIVNNLISFEEIKEVIVVLKNENSEDYLCAYLVINSDTIDLRQVREKLEDILPLYMIPNFFIEVDSIPLTSNGKINKDALPSPLSKGVLQQKEYIAPRNEMEIKLVEVWKELLGIERIGINENFFELGGHSLKLIKLVNAYHKIFNVEIKLKDLFVFKTIEKHAELIEVQSLINNQNNTSKKDEETISF